MKIVMAIMAFLFLAFGAIAGLYTGVYLMFIGGIVDLINSIKATVSDPFTVAYAIAKIVFAAPVGWAVFVLSALIARIFGAAASD